LSAFYLDNDVALEVAELLQDVGHSAVTARDLGREGDIVGLCYPMSRPSVAAREGSTSYRPLAASSRNAVHLDDTRNAIKPVLNE
jgi:hypothetical protein